MRTDFLRAGALTLALAAGAAGQLAAQTVELVSRVDPGMVSDTGTGATPTAQPLLAEPSSRPFISADGNYVVFESEAANLVPGQVDTNRANDVFLKDLTTGTTILVSHVAGSKTAAGSSGSGRAVLSADGRYVAFLSSATNLVPEQPVDRLYPNEYLFLYDRVADAASLVFCNCSRNDFSSLEDLVISADGRYLLFVSNGNQVIPDLQGESAKNVFLYDRVEQTTRLASHTGSSATTTRGLYCQNPSLSGDGRYAVFPCTEDLFSNTGEAILFDRDSGAVTVAGPATKAVISTDGRYAVLQDEDRVYLYSRESGQRTLVTNSAGIIPEFERTLAISGDGRFIAFPHRQGQDRILMLYDRVSQTSTPASRPHRTGTVQADDLVDPSFSTDGRYLVFASLEPSLVPGQTDTNGHWDVFLFDRTSGKRTLVSHADAPATAGDSFSFLPRISANGTRIVFDSTADNLLDDVRDLNTGHDVFVHEIATRRTSLVSGRAASLPSLSSSSASQAAAVSADGLFVAFESDSPWIVSGQADNNGTNDVFLYNRSTRATILVSRGRGPAATAANGQSVRPVLSADGRYVAFASNASNIAPGANDPDGRYDVFLFDRIAGTTTFVARTGELSGPDPNVDGEWPVQLRISPDGRWVAFTSFATDLVPGQQDTGPNDLPTLDVFLWDRTTGKTLLVSRSSRGATITADHSYSSLAALSADGRYVLYGNVASDLVPGQIDTEADQDLFLFDRVAGTNSLVSHAPDSPVTSTSGYGGSLSADGRFVAFLSLGPSGGVQLYDRTLGTSQRIAIGQRGNLPRISADGRFVTFASSDEILPEVPPSSDRQVYLYDRTAQTLTLLSRSSANPAAFGNGGSINPEISADGRYVAFLSWAGDLIPGLSPAPGRGDVDTDVYLFDRTASTITLASRWRGTMAAAGGAEGFPLLSASGRQVAFTSFSELAAPDRNNRTDAYVFSLDPPPPAGPTPLPACTLLDTRRRADRPALTSNVQRTVTFRGACGVPATAKQVRVNVTVFNPSGKGNLRFYPGAVTATPSGILRFERNATRAETFTLPLSPGGTLTILPFVAGKGTVHGVVEVTGYSE